MAASSSENQGMLIALVIFVVLTIVGGVGAYYWFDQWDTMRQERDNAVRLSSDDKKAASDAKQHYQELRGLVFAEMKEEDHTLVAETIRQRLKAPGINEERKKLKSEYKSFEDALAFLENELKDGDTRVTEQAGQISKLQKDVESLQETYKGQVDEITKDRDARADELAAETNKFKESLAQKDQEIAAASEERLRALSAKQDAEQELERFSTEMTRENRELNDIIDSIREEERLRGKIEFVQSDGRIIEINRSNGVTQAYINLGAEDALVNGTTFGVYGRDQGGNPYKLPKARLEVVRIIGSHQAIARVDGNTTDQPVIPGDLLYNPLWSPGDQISIGLVGLVYLDDKDSEDAAILPKGQNAEFLDMAQRLGAKIDAVYDLDQEKVRGELNVDTDWLVIGVIPETKESDTQERKDYLQNLRKAEKKLREQARSNAIEPINVRNFLTFMGKQQPQMTVRAGEERRFLYGKRRPALIDQGPKPANSTEPVSSTANP
jgi:hypothetical protein